MEIMQEALQNETDDPTRLNSRLSDEKSLRKQVDKCESMKKVHNSFEFHEKSQGFDRSTLLRNVMTF